MSNRKRKRSEKELVDRVARRKKALELAEAALAGFRGDRLKGETVEETKARFEAHVKACRYCDSYEAPDRHCATFTEYVKGKFNARGCKEGARILEEAERKGVWT